MSKTKTIHLINPLQNAFGGSEWRTLELCRLLSPHADVRLWASDTPDPGLPAGFPVNIIDTDSGVYPEGGVMVFVGCYYPIGDWVQKTQSERTILIFNTPTVNDLVKTLLVTSALGSRIELVGAAQWMLNQLEVPGIVQTSPIELERFSPQREKTASADVFRVGRLSRDEAAKHHYPDIDLYKALASQGCRVRIMGGMLWQDYLANVAGVELLPVCAETPQQFIRGLDCFYYRTHDQWTEPSGRVIMEAMACGVPVVAYRKGGYAEWIAHGQDGFLFDTPEQALQLILTLRNDPGLRDRIGKAARAKMERMHSEVENNKIVDFYIR